MATRYRSNANQKAVTDVSEGSGLNASDDWMAQPRWQRSDDWLRTREFDVRMGAVKVVALVAGLLILPP